MTETESYILLAAAILGRATDDYKRFLRGEKILEECHEVPDTVKSLEGFFLSTYGQALSDNHGMEIIERCRREVEQEKNNRTHNHFGNNSAYLDYSKGILCEETGCVYKTPKEAAEALGCTVNSIYVACRYDRPIFGKHITTVAKGKIKTK